MSDTSDKKNSKVQSLVVDSGPLIKGANIRPLANKIYTIPEVISEIRDKHSRDFLNQILFDIEIKSPNEESLKEVVNFSKKSGDFSSLSAVDLRVLALTYMLEVEANGKEHLRKEPLKSFARQGGQTKQAGKIRQTEKIKQAGQTGQVKDNEDNGNNENNVDNGNNVKKNEYDDLRENDKIQNNILSNMENLTLSEKNVNDHNDSNDNGKSSNNEIPETLITNDKNNNIDNNDNIEVSLNNNNSDIDEAEIITSQENTLESSNIQDKEKEKEEEKEEDGDDDGDGEWITPDNIKNYKEQKYNIKAKNKRDLYMKVACITTDYTMQNVLLQMRLNLVTVEGIKINKVKNWVLRCHACFKVTHDMEKQFCPSCGNATLIRTSTSTDENGNVIYYLKKNFQYKLRGTKYSIPEPKGGRHANNLILREDQKEYQKALKLQRKQKKIDIFDPDYIPELFIKSNSPSSLKYSGPPVIGYGRRNPNEARRRKKK
ncbi:hypothetical protein Glove_567g9 [Diversispora epigaea]|uniref:20S-pre-rRNA D-site endonuclease NOB1 n=1 Tax=Diversispora epigaea TaxID=1348612 RepID=A0A397GD55_9GLOM|nr:hypothetical protein Glove_567g9 [Diversispora epigaea]